VAGGSTPCSHLQQWLKYTSIPSVVISEREKSHGYRWNGVEGPGTPLDPPIFFKDENRKWGEGVMGDFNHRRVATKKGGRRPPLQGQSIFISAYLCESVAKFLKL
jgi:hypothetical protein